VGKLITRCYDLGRLRGLGRMDEEELLDEGYVLEANRQFFHPLGLELVAEVADDGLRLRVLSLSQQMVFLASATLPGNGTLMSRPTAAVPVPTRDLGRKRDY
jgi:hypothetical protein